jgi:hypothetical protein
MGALPATPAGEVDGGMFPVPDSPLLPQPIQREPTSL